MERLDQGHLNPLLGHSKQTCPGRGLNLLFTAPQAGTLAMIYLNSLHCLLSEPLQYCFMGYRYKVPNSKVPNNKVPNYKFLIYKVPNVTMFLIEKKLNSYV
jgi:hypothetical protein